jgi:hypothetical protein
MKHIIFEVAKTKKVALPHVQRPLSCLSRIDAGFHSGSSPWICLGPRQRQRLCQRHVWEPRDEKTSTRFSTHEILRASKTCTLFHYNWQGIKPSTGHPVWLDTTRSSDSRVWQLHLGKSLWMSTYKDLARWSKNPKHQVSRHFPRRPESHSSPGQPPGCKWSIVPHVPLRFGTSWLDLLTFMPVHTQSFPRWELWDVLVKHLHSKSASPGAV